jgi:hypothetical protein
MYWRKREMYNEKVKMSCIFFKKMLKLAKVAIILKTEGVITESSFVSDIPA